MGKQDIVVTIFVQCMSICTFMHGFQNNFAHGFKMALP